MSGPLALQIAEACNGAAVVLTLLTPPGLLAALGPLRGQLFVEWLDQVAPYVSAWEVWQVGYSAIICGIHLALEHCPQCRSLVAEPGIVSQHHV